MTIKDVILYNQRITLCFILTVFCDRGYFYNTGDKTCRPCPEGQYKSNRGIDTTCKQCQYRYKIIGTPGIKCESEF
jgi:hypothetical protein